ncbi:FAD-dependent oxidoreductase [uncultured Cocleimonas sp.]|uniref:flavin monoamine oxidase family protein n=1 Tax=uncultured Cocleimonas sp. TaxID=1051587 RepID=UPI00261482BA|nr:FAD-dependent oxidoreductase [uncultured Cocleimonas sp.]
MNKIQTDILIVGGGISGLHTAYQLEKLGVSYVLLEARERLGGRILSQNYDVKDSLSNSDSGIGYDADKPAYDLGPSWFWPGQANMEALIKDLGLGDSVFLQQGSGESVYEDQQGNIQKGFYGISMEGTYRMRGGIRQIIHSLEQNVDEDKIRVQTKAQRVEFINNQILTTVAEKSADKSIEKNADKTYQIISNKIVMALPPRIAMSSITFEPSLPDKRTKELNNYSTWMAGHAKVIAVYDSAFWLEQGLSGDAVSQFGPLHEIHDASSDSKYALFGFVGVPGGYRKDNEDEICQSAIDQLIRLFGEKAASPIDIVLQDWAQEEFTATEIDQTMSGGHATSSMSHYTEAGFDDRLIWSGTETANHRQGHNGLLEGALEASTRTLQTLIKA